VAGDDHPQQWERWKCARDGLASRPSGPALSARGSGFVRTEAALTAVAEGQQEADQARLPERKRPLFVRPRVELPARRVSDLSNTVSTAAASCTGVAGGVSWH
jgi:hypothetical protein